MKFKGFIFLFTLVLAFWGVTYSNNAWAAEQIYFQVQVHSFKGHQGTDIAKKLSQYLEKNGIKINQSSSITITGRVIPQGDQTNLVAKIQDSSGKKVFGENASGKSSDIDSIITELAKKITATVMSKF